MKVFKFGGASVKDAQGIKNVGAILEKYRGEKIVVVLSAMGKTTNALENIVASAHYDEAAHLCAELENSHLDVAKACITGERQEAIADAIGKMFAEMRQLLAQYPGNVPDERYDRIVSFGERLSVLIAEAYLKGTGLNVSHQDARRNICTDSNFREANVDFQQTETNIKRNFSDAFKQSDIIITEGFIGETKGGKTTTLGREGSDYTAAIIAYCLRPDSVTIWKDVEGVLNADPKWFDNTVKIDHLSYQDALELAYYGATVIHPKTIKPLQNKNIPLFVKSFLKPAEAGTQIDNRLTHLPVPCFIFKVNQVLLSISPKDFSFIVEANLSRIFRELAASRVKVNVMQNSALNFSICMDNEPGKVPALIASLSDDFRVLYNDNLELVTIRYYDQATIDRVCIDKKVLLEHKSRYTVQLVVQPEAPHAGAVK